MSKMNLTIGAHFGTIRSLTRHCVMYSCVVLRSISIRRRIAALAALGLAGCSGVGEAPPDNRTGEASERRIRGEAAAETGAPAVFAALRRPEPPRLASTLGTLTVADGCFRLVNEHSSYPIVWPAGSRFDAATRTVVPPGGGSGLKLGERIALRGGAMTIDARFNQRLTAPLPDGCLGKAWMAAFE